LQALVAPAAGAPDFASVRSVGLGDAASAAVTEEDVGAATTAASGSGIATTALALGAIAVEALPVAAFAVAGALGVTAAHATIAEKPARSTVKAGGGRIINLAYHMGHDARELCVAHVSHLGRVR
jgi:hypothetical protein